MDGGDARRRLFFAHLDQSEVDEGVLGAEFDRADRAEVTTEVKTAEAAAKDEVWSGYRFVILSDAKAANGLKVIDLGAGHASANQTLSGHILAALKTEALLNESIRAGYIDRHLRSASLRFASSRFAARFAALRSAL
jgi:hypothetical protein